MNPFIYVIVNKLRVCFYCVCLDFYNATKPCFPNTRKVEFRARVKTDLKTKEGLNHLPMTPNTSRHLKTSKQGCFNHPPCALFKGNLLASPCESACECGHTADILMWVSSSRHPPPPPNNMRHAVWFCIHTAHINQVALALASFVPPFGLPICISAYYRRRAPYLISYRSR